MARGIDIIAAFLVCATAASAVLAPFPHGKTTTYRYRTVVSTRTSHEGLYSSQFVLQGTLDVTHDTRDPELVNAYNVVLANVSTDMHNGETVDYDEKLVGQSVDSAARVIQDPFLIIYNTNGTFQAVKIGEYEPEWSKNMKMAMAAMLQLDLPNINVENLASKSRSFVSQEKTIHGDCSVTYDVFYSKDPVNSNIPEEFSVNKTFSPVDCVGFALHEFNNVDNDHCTVNKKQLMFTESTRDFKIEKQDDGILIKKLVAYGSVNVLSSNGASYPHFVITNTTFEFLQVKGKSENDVPLGNFNDAPIIRDVTYRKPQRSYVPNAAVDVTQGRRVVDLKSIPHKLQKLLIEAINYIDENHLDPNEMDWNRARTLNKILQTMSYMDVDALQVTFGILENMVHPEAARVTNIFLGVVPQVGTPASCNFTRNIILKNQIPALTAIQMLIKLPLNVKVPTTELLAQMEELAMFNDPIHAEVRKAGIISFSSLIYRTFKHVSRPEESTVLNKYLHDFCDHVKNEPTYEMKVVYLMAIKNIQVGKIYDLLEPIIDGSLTISENPEHIQLLAIWAISKAVEEDYNAALRILWPVMVNGTLSTKLRIAAYEILMKQAPDKDNALKVHQYVSSEGNEHFYNYHYTNLDGIAKSADQCKVNNRKIVRSILEKLDYHPKSQNYRLSGVHSIGYIDGTFTDAEKIDIGVVVNELTGLPEVLQLEYVVTDNDGAVSEIALQVHIEGQIMTVLRPAGLGRGLPLTMLREILDEAARSLPAIKKLHIDIVLMRNGRVVIANHYNLEKLSDTIDDVMEYYWYHMRESFAINYQNVAFDRLYEKQLTSDIGFPVVVETRVPIVSSVKINYTNSQKSPSVLDLVTEIKTWKHGDYSMSVYNPMKDVWHAVRLVTVTEVSLPLRTNITLDRSAGILKFSFPERPAMVSPVAGFLLRGKHLVTVDEDGTRALMESCHTCHHQEDAHDGSQREDRREYIERISDSKDTGLKFSSYNYGCEYGYMSESYLDYKPDWDRTFSSNISNSWTDLLVQGIMDARRAWKTVVFDSQMASCGGILKVEPSTNHSISRIVIYPRVKYDDFDSNETTLELLHAEKWKFNVTFDVISSLTNSTARLWNFDLGVDMNRGHLEKKVSVHITRKTPEEKDLKICIDVKKNYPAAPSDDLKLGETNEEIDTKLTVAYGHTNGEECVRNETLVTMTLKAQLSDEQKNRLKHDLENSGCSKDAKNPLYASPRNQLPRTMNCVNEAIRYTTLRKYTVDVTHEKLSPNVAAFMYRYLTDHLEPRETGNLKFQVEFPMEKNSIDFQFMTDTNDMTKVNFDLKSLQRDGHGPVMNSLWDFPLDNSRFSLKYLYDLTEDDIRICSIYPQVVLTGDGEYRPFTIPSHEWTLVSGEYYEKDFAIFVKQPRPNYLSFLVFIKNHGVHFFTREGDNVLVAMADGVEPPTEEGFRLPVEENFGRTLKVTKRDDHFVVRFQKVSLTLLIGPNFISIMFDSELQGYVSGLCGHLNGNSLNGSLEIHSTKEINGY